MPGIFWVLWSWLIDLLMLEVDCLPSGNQLLALRSQLVTHLLHFIYFRFISLLFLWSLSMFHHPMVTFHDMHDFTWGVTYYIRKPSHDYLYSTSSNSIFASPKLPCPFSDFLSLTKFIAFPLHFLLISHLNIFILKNGGCGYARLMALREGFKVDGSKR